MPEPIRIDPAVLREVAAGHEEVAAIVQDARDRGGDIMAAVESYGPIMHEVKSAVADVLLDRDTALAQHINRHRNASDELQRGALEYTAADDHNAQEIRDV